MPTDETVIEGFRFLVPVAKATEEDGKLYVEGVASSTSLDAQGQRITKEGQASMARWANTGTVVLGGEADHYRVAFDDDLGTIEKGEVTPDGEFYIRAALDADNPRAVHLHKKIAGGTQLGLSVFGRVTKSAVGDDNVPEIEGVRLTRVMVTKRPANPDTWITAVAKSLAGPDPASEPESVDLDAAKGKFVDLLNQYNAREIARAPVKDQSARVTEIVRLTRFLEQAAMELEWGSDADPGMIADAIAAAIAEYQGEVATKDGSDAPDEMPAETLAPQPDVAAAEEIAPAVESPEPDPAAPAPDAAKTEAAPDPDPPQPAADAVEHPAVKIAKSFAEAASALFAEDLDPQEQRAEMRALLGGLAAETDAALSSPDKTQPAWAARLFERLDALERRLAAAPAGPVAKNDGRPEAGDTSKPGVNLDALRKSVPPEPEIRPSAVVAKATSFADVVAQLFGAGTYPDKV